MQTREQIRKRHRRAKRRFWLCSAGLMLLTGIALWFSFHPWEAVTPRVPWITEPYMEYGTETGTDIDTSAFTDPSVKNNLDLVAFAQEAWRHQWGYVWGMFGDVLTETWLEDKMEQYPQEVGQREEIIRENWLGRRTTDCVGLIKAYGWFDPATGVISYASGSMPDCSTETMFEAAVEKGGLDTMPEIPGIIVYREGHVGIYIGDGFVIEAKGTEYGVVKTKLAESDFTHWFKCPYIEYYE